MSKHYATIQWKNEGNDFSYPAYDRTHTWTFEGGTIVKAASAPEFLGKIEFVNPEEAFVASLSSCHMLTFLAIASRKRFIVESYSDAAFGLLEKNEKGRLAVTIVTLNPVVEFKGDKFPTQEQITEMHEISHEEC